jgi:hypothetical protein
MITTFDTHELVKDLKAAGFNDDQAEAVTRAVTKARDIDLSNLATKTDLATLATKTDLASFATKTDLASFATKTDLANFATKTDLANFATKTDLANFATKTELAELKADLIKWVVGIAFAQIATIIAILKLFPGGHP